MCRARCGTFFGDLLSSVGVIVSAIVIYFTGLQFFDPLVSIVIGGIIFTGGIKILKESYLILMESVPAHFNLDEIRAAIGEVEGVEDVHEMHLWAVSSDHYSLTAHVFVDEKNPAVLHYPGNQRSADAKKYGIGHSTIQMEHANIHPHGEYGREFFCASRKRRNSRKLRKRTWWEQHALLNRTKVRRAYGFASSCRKSSI